MVEQKTQAEEEPCNTIWPELKKFLCSWIPPISLILAALFIFLGVTFTDITIEVKSMCNLTMGVILAWSVFICSARFRLLIAITSIMGFNIWLVMKGINTIAELQKDTAKETAFIIAVAIFAWLAISCYSLSLLKDSQLEDG